MITTQETNENKEECQLKEAIEPLVKQIVDLTKLGTTLQTDLTCFKRLVVEHKDTLNQTNIEDPEFLKLFKRNVNIEIDVLNELIKSKESTLLTVAKKLIKLTEKIKEIIPQNLQGLLKERNELYQKIVKFTKEINNEQFFNALNSDEQRDIKLQNEAMFNYLQVLNERLKNSKFMKIPGMSDIFSELNKVVIEGVRILDLE
jgi:hypothetical protein